MENVVIIGSGPAGLTSALYTSRANLGPVLFEGLQPGGQLTTTTEVENYPGFPEGIDGTKLVMDMKAQCERFGTRFLQREVTSVEFGGASHKLNLDDATQVEARVVIVSTGASAKYLGIESEQKLIGKGVTACATCDGAFYRDVPVAVVGGGDTAMEEALFLTRFASKVHLIHRRDAFRASKIMADRVLAHDKIEVVWNSTVAEVMDVEKGAVTGLKLRNTQTDEESELLVEGLFMAIGHQPNTAAFVGQLEMDENGYIIAENTKTNVAGVFAAGDVQDHVYRQAVTAAGTGCMAALEAERYLDNLEA